MERDYAKLRFAETRYRLLFQTARRAGAHRRCHHAEDRRGQSGGDGAYRGARRPSAWSDGSFLEPFSTPATPARPGDACVTCATATAAGGRGGALRRRRAGRTVTSPPPSARRHADDPRRADPPRTGDGTGTSALPTMLCRRRCPTRCSTSSRLARRLRAADSAGRIMVSANRTFAEMVQVVGRRVRLRGRRALEQWFGRPGVDLDVMMANLRQHGNGSAVRDQRCGGEAGALLEVEASPAMVGRTRQDGELRIRRSATRRPAARPQARSDANCPIPRSS